VPGHITKVADMRRHVEALIALYLRKDLDYGIQVYWLPRTDGALVIRDLDHTVLEIRLPRIRSIISYAIALHEIGHVRGRYQHSRHVMTRERWAWQWARENALIWSPTMERTAAKSLFGAQADQAWRALRQRSSRPNARC
jgi:hypothetical protein